MNRSRFCDVVGTPDASVVAMGSLFGDLKVAFQSYATILAEATLAVDGFVRALRPFVRRGLRLPDTTATFWLREHGASWLLSLPSVRRLRAWILRALYDAT